MDHNNLFATLPAELRVVIYDYALPARSVFKPSERQTNSQEAVLPCLSLLLVDRLTHKECYPIFVRANKFIMTPQQWLEASNNSGLWHNITRLGLTGWHFEAQDILGLRVLRSLTSAPRLARAEILYGSCGSYNANSVRSFASFKIWLALGASGTASEVVSGLILNWRGKGTYKVRCAAAQNTAVILFRNPHFCSALEAFKAATRQPNWIVAGQSDDERYCVQRLRALTWKLRHLWSSSPGQEFAVPAPLARVWSQVSLEETEYSKMIKGRRFRSALDEAMQDWLYYADAEERMPWVMVTR